MRTSSSRQVVGSETVCVTDGRGTFVPGSRPLVPVACGIRARRDCPTELIGTAAKLATFGQSTDAGTQRSVKSPLRSASEGTFCVIVEGFFSRRHSSEKKKKVFFLSLL